jgi:hypothetical protein
MELNEEDQKLIAEMKSQIKTLNIRIEELERKCKAHIHMTTGEYQPTTQPLVW